MQRFLGVDYGSVRIGLAVGDDESNVATPVATISARGGVDAQVRTVAEMAAEYGVDALVLGLPRNMNGTEGPQCRRTRAFGTALAGTAGRPVHYYDERLSSRAADELLAPAELTATKRRRRRDAVAAQIILQGFLDARAAGRSASRPGE